MLSSGKKHWCHILCPHTSLPGPSAKHASLFLCLMQHIQSELMKTPCVECVLLELPRRRDVKEIESNGRTPILSLPYRLFINLTVCSDACLLLESVHTHHILPSTNQLAIICFSVQGSVTTNTFGFDIELSSEKINTYSNLRCK